jgi:GTP-binding protein Era
VGRPNVGKSTLVNRLVGARVSITSRKAQTTRHRVTGIVTSPDAQFVFVDTPGFQTKHRSRLNDRLNRTVSQSLAGVDAAILVIEAGRTTDADRAVSARCQRAPDRRANRVDQLRTQCALPRWRARGAHGGDLACERGRTGTQTCFAEVGKLLPPGAPLFDVVITDRANGSCRVRPREDLPAWVRKSVRDDGASSTKADSQNQATVFVDRDASAASARRRRRGRDEGDRVSRRTDMERLFGGLVFPGPCSRQAWADSEALTRFALIAFWRPLKRCAATPAGVRAARHAYRAEPVVRLTRSNTGVEFARGAKRRSELRGSAGFEAAAPVGSSSSRRS